MRRTVASSTTQVRKLQVLAWNLPPSFDSKIKIIYIIYRTKFYIDLIFGIAIAGESIYNNLITISNDLSAFTFKTFI